jgi:hypothetical protein
LRAARDRSGDLFVEGAFAAQRLATTALPSWHEYVS